MTWPGKWKAAFSPELQRQEFVGGLITRPGQVSGGFAFAKPPEFSAPPSGKVSGIDQCLEIDRFLRQLG